MKEDIKFLPVEKVVIAVARVKNELNQFNWSVYVLNRNDFGLKNVLIRSKGYGVLNGEEQKTSVLRHHFEWVDPNGFVLIEPIDPTVFHLNNEYWLSYYVEGQVYDKKFIFVPDTIIEKNLTYIPELELEGILHP